MKLVTCMLSLAIAVALGCGATQATQVKQVTYACSNIDIGRTIPEIGMTIFQDAMAIIQAGADGWVDKLAEIGTKYGEDTLACVAKAVYDALTPSQSGAKTSTPTAAALRAKTFIDTRSYRYQ